MIIKKKLLIIAAKWAPAFGGPGAFAPLAPRLTWHWLGHFKSANKVENDQRRDALLACVGKETFGLLRALVAPTKTKGQDF